MQTNIISTKSFNSFMKSWGYMVCSQLAQFKNIKFDYLLGLSETGGVMAAGLAAALGSMGNPKPWGLVQWSSGKKPILPLKLSKNLDQRVLMVDDSLESLRVFEVMGAIRNPGRIVGLIHYGKNDDELVFSSFLDLWEFLLRLVRPPHRPRIL